MLEKEFRYFPDNQSELVKSYNGKYLVIKDEKVIGAYDTRADAYFIPSQEHEVGTFLIQLCIPGEKAYTISVHSRRVYFA
jgi:hypothetical protein